MHKSQENGVRREKVFDKLQILCYNNSEREQSGSLSWKGWYGVAELYCRTTELNIVPTEIG